MCRGARHAAADVGDAEAALPVLRGLVADRGDLGIDEHERLARRPRPSASSEATNSRSPSCTCGAASPTPWYSAIVSSMSSMSCWMAGLGDLVALERRVFCAEHGVAHARDFQNRHVDWIIRRVGNSRPWLRSMHGGHVADVPLHPHDDSHALPVLPGAAGRARAPAAEEHRARAARAARACGYVFYIDPKIAVGTIIRTEESRIVLVRRAIEPGYGKWVFPGGYVDRGETARGGRGARGAGGVRPRRPPRRAGQHLLLRRPRAGDRRLCRDGDGRRRWPWTRRAWRRRVRAGDCRGRSSRSAARATLRDELAFRSTREALTDYLAQGRDAS